MVGAYEAGVPAGRRYSSIVGTEADFPDDVPHIRGAAQRPERAQQSGIAAALVAVGRLVIPVALLLTTFAASYLYNDTKLASLGIPADGLTLGYLLLPTTFFAIHLTNRRYGPAYAFAQIVASWGLAIAGFVLVRIYAPALDLPAAIPDGRVLAAFAAGLFLAQTTAVVVFDGARGPRWWSAPLFSSLWGAVVFSVIYFPTAFLGRSGVWLNDMLIDLGLMVGMGVLLMIPYWLLRPLVRPLPGFGGY